MITIDNSVLNLKLANELLKNIKSFSATMQRMTTGLKINKPSDDPAGFYTANKFGVQISGLNTANANIQAAVNILGQADKSLESVNKILGQMRTLIESSCNDYLTPSERAKNQEKINELFTSAIQIRDEAEIDGLKVFSETTILDKNKTYTDGKETAVAAGMVLNRLGDRPAESTQDGGEAATAVSEPEAAGVAAAAYDGGGEAIPAYSGEDDDDGTIPLVFDETESEPEAAAMPMMMSMRMMSPAPAAASAEDEGGAAYGGEDDANAGIAMASVEDEGIAAYSAGTLTLDGTTQELTITNGTHTYVYDVQGTNGETLTWGIHETTGQVTFEADSSVSITAHSGQRDNIIYGVQGGTLNTGDGNDTVVTVDSDGRYSTINTGDGDDSITASAFYTTIDSGAGNDYVLNDGWYSTIATGAGNDTIYNQALGATIYSGADDDYLLNNSHSANIDTGDGNDSVNTSVTDYYSTIALGAGNDTINSYATSGIVVDGGDGVDSYYSVSPNTFNNFEEEAQSDIVDWDNYIDLGKDGTFEILANDMQVVMINNNKYLIKNIHRYARLETLTYSTDTTTNQITLSCEEAGSHYLEIIAKDGQQDNINFNIRYGTLNTGDDTDTIVNICNGAIINAGDGADSIVNSGYSATVNAGDGADSIENSGSSATVNAGDDADSIVNSGSNATVNAGDGADSIENSGSSATVNLGTGDDTVSNEAGWVLINKNGFTSDNDVINTTKTDTMVVDNLTSINFSANQEQTLTLGDKNYTIVNKTNKANTLNYFIADDGQITFVGSSFGVTSNGDQDDNILFGVEAGVLNTGDGEDSVINKYKNSSISLGAGNDTLYNEGQYVIIDAGDGDDNVELVKGSGTGSVYSSVSLGAGNDTINNAGTLVTIDGGDDFDVLNMTDTNESTNTNIESIYDKNGDLIYGTEAPTPTPELSGTLALDGTTQELTISNGTHTYVYDVRGASVGILTWGIHETTGQVMFESDSNYSVSITAHSGQRDNVVIDGEYIHFYAGDEDDTLVVNGAHSVYMGSGNDSITVDGEISGPLDAGDGDNNIILNSYASVGTITSGSGADTITLNSFASVGSVNAGSGADTITVAQNATGYHIFSGAGNDSITVDGEINGILDAGEGDNNITLNSYASVGSVNAGSGADTITLNSYASVGDIFAGSGADTITVAQNAIIGYHISSGAGDDAITVDGEIGYRLDAGDGNDSITVDGKIHNSLEAGEGNDEVIWGDNASVGGYGIGNIQGAIDNNKVTGVETIYDEPGNQIYPEVNNTDGNGNIVDGEGNVVGGSGSDGGASVEGGSGTETISIGAHQTVTILIDGKKYDVENPVGTTKTLTYSLNSGQITFESSDELSITAHSGQKDNVVLDGEYIRFDAGDEDDTLTVMNGASIYAASLGAGNDSITVDGIVNSLGGEDGNDVVIWGDNASVGGYGIDNIQGAVDNNYVTGVETVLDESDNVLYSSVQLSGTLTLNGSTQELTITNGTHTYVYDVQGYSGQTLSWGIHRVNGRVTFESSDSTWDKPIVIEAHNVQNDNINFNVDYGILNTGEGNDYINISSNNSTVGAITTGSGSDTIYVGEYGAVSGDIDTGYGDDSIFGYGGFWGEIYTGVGNDSITVNRWTEVIDTGYGDDTLVLGDNASVGVYDINNVRGAVENNLIRNVETILDTRGNDLSNGFGTLTLDGTTQELTITNGTHTYVYDVQGTNGDTLTWGIHEITGRVTFESDSSVSIIAHSGQRDNVVLDGECISFDAGDEDDTLVVNGAHCVYMGSGNDSITVDGIVDWLDAGEGNDSITVDGEINTLDAGEGDNNITLNSYASVGSVNAGSGADTITVAQNATGYHIFSGAGDDSITVDGEINGILDAGEGDNNITLNSYASVGSVNAGSGADTITLNSYASVGDIFAGSGADTITVAQNAIIGYHISSGAGDDVITVDGEIGYRLDAGDGNDSITVDGVIKDLVDTGEGNDEVIWGANASVGGYGIGNIQGAIDNNKVTDVETIYDEHGNQIYPEVNNTDGNGNVVDGEGNVVGGSDSDGSASVEGGSGTETISIGADQTVTVLIDGKKYDVRNFAGTTKTLTYSLNSGQITFESSDALSITAHSGQRDNVVIDGAGIRFDAGDEDDNIRVNNAASILLGAGNDAITVDGEIRDLDAGEGDNNITLNSYASVGFVYAGSGADTITVAQNATGCHIFSGAGDDSITVDGEIGGTLDAGDGDNNITLNSYASVGLVNAGSGADTITVAQNAIIRHYIISGAGDDSITVDGEIYNYLDAGTGNDSITVDGEINTLYAGEGNDSITVDGISGTLDAGDGDNNITLNSYASVGAVNAGSGADIITLNSYASVGGSITSGSGADTITVAQNAIIGCHIISGAGNDSITVDGVIQDCISGDGDNDTLYWGANASIGGYGVDESFEAVENAKIQYIENINANGETIVSIAAGETLTLDIDGKKYDVTNSEGDTKTLTYSLNSGQITFESSDELSITAHSRQRDNVVIDGAGIRFDAGDEDDTLVVNGAHSVYMGSGNDSITVDGEIGDLYAGAGNDSITVDGFVDWLDAEEGDDYISINSTVGFLYAGAGSDTVLAKGDVTQGLYAGAGNDSITVDGRIGGTLDAGDGNDSITVDGEIGGTLDAGEGDDYISINSTVGYLYAGAGNDTVLAKGDVAYVDAGTGNDAITVDGEINDLYAGDGDNNITLNSYASVGYIFAGSGADTITVAQNAIIGYHITSGAGNDSITVDGISGFLDAGDGDDTLNINTYATVGATIVAGDGDDVLTIAGTVVGYHLLEINTGAGDDYLLIKETASIGAHVGLGSGNDTLYTHANVEGAINGGADNDDIYIYTDNNDVYGDDGEDMIFIYGDSNNSDGGNGDDYTIISGNDNFALGGSDGYDKIESVGSNNTYSQMNELVSSSKKVSVQTDWQITPDSQFTINLSAFLPKIEFDVSSNEKAQEALKQLDEIIAQITKSRAEIGMQNNLLDNHMKYNLTRIANLENSRSYIQDADVAEEYNKLITQASLIEQIQLLQSQASTNHYNLLTTLIRGIAS